MSWSFSGKYNPLEQVLSPGRRQAVLPRTLVSPEKMLQGQIPAASLSEARTWAPAQAAQCSCFSDLDCTGAARVLGHHCL